MLTLQALPAETVLLSRTKRARYDKENKGIPLLTTRQKEVLQHAADGYSSQESAELLGLSPESVKAHRKLLLKKLGARSMTNAVALAVDGLLVRPSRRLGR